MALAPYRGYTQAQADEVTNKYKSNDMVSFGLTFGSIDDIVSVEYDGGQRSRR